jgi:hypothetical protein
MDGGEIRVGGPFSPTEKSIIEYGGAPGIARLHGDITPRNVFLDRLKYPHIADFGAAKVVVDGTGGTSITKPGRPCM